jgi:hypothetical protein
MKQHWMRRAPKILVIVALVVTVVAFMVMMLWNWLIPSLFHGPVLTFWQALGLLVLSRLLLGGFRGRPGPPPWHWKRRMRERWAQMTPEERERFRQGSQKGWNPFGPFGPPDEPTSR